MSKCVLLVQILCIFSYTQEAPLDDDPLVVELPNGLIRGRTAFTFTQKEFTSFQGIPFATPPVRDLRFKAPIPPSNWEGVLDTSGDNNVICYQSDYDAYDETEDCLYLNVYTANLPSLNNNGSGELLPVMFYIYGGGFVDGNCPFNSCGPEFLIDRDVIVITINYRVGPFGFLSTEDLVLPGNAGLKDQQLAIRWAHDNVALFGGDPEKITIFGQSAGSASVTYQLLNQDNEGLFRAAICQSGSFLSPWAFQRKSREYAFKTAALINDTFSNSDDSEQLLDFLLSVPAKQIDDASKAFRSTATLETKELNQGFFYAPIVEPEHEGAFITEKMYGSLKNGNILKIPILIGIASEESIIDAADLNYLNDISATYDQHLNWVVPNDMLLEDADAIDQVAESIRDLYAGNGTTFQENLPATIRFHSDTAFSRSVIKTAEMYSQFSDVFFYQFSYDGEIGNIGVKLEGCEKVGHGEDVNYVFRKTEYYFDNSDLSKFPESDVLVLNRVQKIWTNFAKYLNPTPEEDELLQDIIWPKVTPDNFQYVNIDTDLSIKSDPKGRVFKGWNAIYSSLPRDDFDTY